MNPSKEEWAEIIGMTDLLFNNFLTDLRNKYSITRHEQEICCLIKWNFSRKEQLAVFNNTPDALTKSKGRLKKRLGLDEKTDLESASIIFEKTMEALFIIYLSLSISEISEETKSDTQ